MGRRLGRFVFVLVGIEFSFIVSVLYLLCGIQSQRFIQNLASRSSNFNVSSFLDKGNIVGKTMLCADDILGSLSLMESTLLLA